MLAGLGLAVGDGDIAGRSINDTGDGIRLSSPSGGCRIPWGLGMGDAGTAGNVDGDSVARTDSDTQTKHKHVPSDGEAIGGKTNE